MPHRYPQQVALRDGRRVLLRPFAASDTDALFEFFQRLPIEYRNLLSATLDQTCIFQLSSSICDRWPLDS